VCGTIVKKQQTAPCRLEKVTYDVVQQEADWDPLAVLRSRSISD
jgi:hypothetical protein